MSDNQQRRETDKVSHHDFSISKLIAEEDDVKQRTFLLLMSDMSQSLTANTKLTRSLAESIDAHVTDFKAHVVTFDAHAKQHEEWANKAKGMAMVWRFVYGFILFVVPIAGYTGWQWVQDTGGKIGNLEARIQKVEDVSRAIKLFEGKRE